MRQALIRDGIVANIIVSGGLDLGIPIGDDEQCEIGSAYVPDGNPRFIKPPRVYSWTSYQFLLKFTAEELESVRERANTDPICWRFLTLATAAQEVVSNDPMTIAGMDYLVAVGLLTEQRKTEILSE